MALARSESSCCSSRLCLLYWPTFTAPVRTIGITAFSLHQHVFARCQAARFGRSGSIHGDWLLRVDETQRAFHLWQLGSCRDRFLGASDIPHSPTPFITSSHITLHSEQHNTHHRHSFTIPTNNNHPPVHPHNLNHSHHTGPMACTIVRVLLALQMLLLGTLSNATPVNGLEPAKRQDGTLCSS